MPALSWPVTAFLDADESGMSSSHPVSTTERLVRASVPTGADHDVTEVDRHERQVRIVRVEWQRVVGGDRRYSEFEHAGVEPESAAMPAEDVHAEEWVATSGQRSPVGFVVADDELPDAEFGNSR